MNTIFQYHGLDNLEARKEEFRFAPSRRQSYEKSDLTSSVDTRRYLSTKTAF